MKTQHELKYEKLITEIILSDNCKDFSQLDLFMDFHRNSYTYYDYFCDALFSMSCGHTTDSLWITPSGRPYLSSGREHEADYLVITRDQIPEFIDDLYEQLETAFACLQRLV